MSTEREGTPGPREEKGTAASSRRHPPHVSEGEDSPVLPANAAGEDLVRPDVPQEIDPESMYDRRPGQDKDRKETDMP
jgi:hypothetical protein